MSPAASVAPQAARAADSVAARPPAHGQARTASRVAPVLTSVPGGALIQRKCACGGTPGADGECAECRKKRLGVQAQLRVSQPGDRYEQEADRLAARVVGGGRAGAISPAATGGGPQRSAESAGGQAEVAALPPLGGGRPLAREVRESMEVGLGHDFSRVRIHDGPRAATSAKAFEARAYTLGERVVFGAGQLNTASRAGRTLLAHELVHVAQQGAAAPLAGGSRTVSPTPEPRIQRAPASPAAVAADPVSDPDLATDEQELADPRAISPDVPTAVPAPHDPLELTPIYASALPGQFARYEANVQRTGNLASGPVFWRVTAASGVRKAMKVVHLTRDAGASEPRKLTKDEIRERRCNVIELRFDESLVRFGGQTIELEVGSEPFAPGGGDQSVTLIIRGVQGGRFSELEKAGRAGDTAAVESLVGASVRVRDCEPGQEKTVISAWGGAVALASKALGRLDGTRPEELLRKKLFAEEHPVRMALRRNFFPSKGLLARLDLDEVREVIAQIKPRITRARNDLLTGGTFQCSSACQAGTCARPEAAASVAVDQLGANTPINVCHPFFECTDHDFRVRALFHEAIHRQGVMVPPDQEVYRWDKDAWAHLRREDTLKMADAYALFVWEVVKGKKSYGSLT